MIRWRTFCQGGIAAVFVTLTLSGCLRSNPPVELPEARLETSAIDLSVLPPLTPEEEDFIYNLAALTIGQAVVIASEAYDLALANPSMTKADLDEYIIDEVALAAQSTLVPANISDPYDRFMSQTGIVALYLASQSPFEALIVRHASTLPDGERQIRFPGEVSNNPPSREDAFRHTLGMILSVEFLDRLTQFTLLEAEQFATAAGLANECMGLGPVIMEACRVMRWGDDYTDTYSQNSLIMKSEMDLVNNAWAIAWAAQNLPTLSFQERSVTSLADMVEGLVRGPGTPYSGLVTVGAFSSGNYPAFASDCLPVSDTIDWCLIPVEEDPLNQRGVVFVLLEDVANLLYAESMYSFANGDLSSLGGMKDHSVPTDNESHLYAFYQFQPGTHLVEVVGLDTNDYLVWGVKKEFTLAAGESARFVPSIDYALLDGPVNYDGPVDDCQRLNVTYSVQVDGLHDGTSPPVAVNPSTSSMYLDGMGLPLLEYQKLGNDPLIVEAATIRSCNVEEGNYLLGWDIDAGFLDPTLAVGYYVFIDTNISNLDNSWPGAVWNRTDLTPDPTICPVVPLDFSFSSVAGKPRAAQTFIGVPANEHEVFYSSLETLYLWTSTAYDVNNSPVVISSGNWSPPYLDEKFTYNGLRQWVHLVTEWPSHACGPSALDQVEGSNLQLTPGTTWSWIASDFPSTERTRHRLEDIGR